MYKVHMFNAPTTPLRQDTPPRGNVKPTIFCETLEEAKIVAKQNKKLFEYIRIYTTSDMRNPVIEYVNGNMAKIPKHHN